jgi:hypothetical protein
MNFNSNYPSIPTAAGKNRSNANAIAVSQWRSGAPRRADQDKQAGRQYRDSGANLLAAICEGVANATIEIGRKESEI